MPRSSATDNGVVPAVEATVQAARAMASAWRELTGGMSSPRRLGLRCAAQIQSCRQDLGLDRECLEEGAGITAVTGHRAPRCRACSLGA